MNERKLFYDVPAGHSIDQAAHEMTELASGDNMPVVALFNEVKIEAQPYSLQSEVCDQYYRGMDNRRKAAIANESRSERLVRGVRRALGYEE